MVSAYGACGGEHAMPPHMSGDKQVADQAMIFCTLFNWAYLAQGVALYRSLQRTRGDDFVLYVLCMDDISAEYLTSLALPNLRLVALRDIEDETLLAVKAHRTLGEYCW